MKIKSCLLPKLIRKDSHVKRSRQTVFGGLSSNPDASSHEITAMAGMSPLSYPALGTGERRFRYETNTSGNPHGIFHHRHLVMARGDRLYTLTKEGVLSALTTVSDTDKTFAAFGSYLFVFPDGICYHVESGTVRPLSVDTGFLPDAHLGSNYVTYAAMDWSKAGFYPGDGVQVCVKNYILGSVSTFTCKVSGMTAGTLFLDTTFEMTGDYDISVSRFVPEMTHLCALGDRLLGCHGNTVYLSEAGNPFNWIARYGDGRDPVILETSGAGDFTACAVYQDRGVFFKEDHIYQMFGSCADDYVLSDLGAPGVAAGSARSLCEVGGRLYYLSNGGVYSFDGEYPVFTGEALPYGLTDGVGGTDGVCYYLSAHRGDGVYQMYACHAERGMWYVRDRLPAASMTQWEDMLFIQTITGDVLRYARPGESLPKNQALITETASAFPSMVSFGEELGGGPDGLRLHGVYLRAQGEANAVLTVEVAYDGEDRWEQIGIVRGEVKGWVRLSLYPRRAESYRLRLVMTGEWRISEITCEYEPGKQ